MASRAVTYAPIDMIHARPAHHIPAGAIAIKDVGPSLIVEVEDQRYHAPLVGDDAFSVYELDEAEGALPELTDWRLEVDLESLLDQEEAGDRGMVVRTAHGSGFVCDMKARSTRVVRYVSTAGRAMLAPSNARLIFARWRIVVGDRSQPLTVATWPGNP